MNGLTPLVMVMLVVGEVRVESRLLLMSEQVKLYPVMIPFCSSGGSHSSVTLCEKKVVLEQLIGGDGGAVEEEVQNRE